MIRRLLLGLGAASLVLTMSATAVLAGNPSGSGQPSVECGSENPVEPAGFTNNGGFQVAEDNYAGEGSGSANANSDAAVSQYDVACYQLTNH